MSSSTSTNPNPYSTSTFTYNPISSTIWTNLAYHQLDNLSSIIEFDYDENDYLNDNISGIKDDIIQFNNDLVAKNHLQPFELIMKMIKNQTSFNIKITVGDILIVRYYDVVFKKVRNNFNLSLSTTSFSILDVEYEYTKIEYENIKLDISEKRKEKLTKIFDYENIKEK